MKSSIFIFFLCLVLLACGKPAPEHAIYGKWQSIGEDKAIFTFSKDNIMRVESFDDAGKTIFKETRGFVIYDENTVRIIDDIQPQYKVRVYAEIKNGNEISLRCTSRPGSQGQALIEHSNFCIYSQLEKIRE